MNHLDPDPRYVPEDDIEEARRSGNVIVWLFALLAVFVVVVWLVTR